MRKTPLVSGNLSSETPLVAIKLGGKNMVMSSSKNPLWLGVLTDMTDTKLQYPLDLKVQYSSRCLAQVQHQQKT